VPASFPVKGHGPLMARPLQKRSLVLEVHCSERDELLHALLRATDDLRQLSPRLSTLRVLAYRDSLPEGLGGAYVTLLGDRGALQVIVLADTSSRVDLARRFFELNDRRDLDPLEIRTGVCDLAATLAHGLRRRLSNPEKLLSSPPVFVDGIALATRDQDLRAAEVVLGSVRVTLALMAPNPKASCGDLP
jgi:hypothetical protein